MISTLVFQEEVWSRDITKTLQKNPNLSRKKPNSRLGFGRDLPRNYAQAFPQTTQQGVLEADVIR
jgi:hypothetical protein